eukprot:gnl/TRDRNA2_/TRDRNA2_36291_c0_seq1.p1 gnl/TRDRNA2_/TRDRNA2_36291_c0~~gnl/TRDRNA2_/TRDRNA2_36291_c0_seq1.p1  ORF type:complete len:550 (-),score=104.40 gnl/TRDRNA2_/TRDRNA2_36291_c0_seq1:19-1530(-)
MQDSESKLHRPLFDDAPGPIARLLASSATPSVAADDGSSGCTKAKKPVPGSVAVTTMQDSESKLHRPLFDDAHGPIARLLASSATPSTAADDGAKVKTPQRKARPPLFDPTPGEVATVIASAAAASKRRARNTSRASSCDSALHSSAQQATVKAAGNGARLAALQALAKKANMSTRWRAHEEHLRMLLADSGCQVVAQNTFLSLTQNDDAPLTKPALTRSAPGSLHGSPRSVPCEPEMAISAVSTSASDDVEATQVPARPADDFRQSFADDGRLRSLEGTVQWLLQNALLSNSRIQSLEKRVADLEEENAMLRAGSLLVTPDSVCAVGSLPPDSLPNASRHEAAVTMGESPDVWCSTGLADVAAADGGDVDAFADTSADAQCARNEAQAIDEVVEPAALESLQASGVQSSALRPETDAAVEGHCEAAAVSEGAVCPESKPSGQAAVVSAAAKRGSKKRGMKAATAVSEKAAASPSPASKPSAALLSLFDGSGGAISSLLTSRE